MSVYTDSDDAMVKYTCNNEDCAKYFYRLSDMEQESKLKCPHCNDGEMEISEL